MFGMKYVSIAMSSSSLDAVDDEQVCADFLTLSIHKEPNICAHIRNPAYLLTKASHFAASYVIRMP